MLSMKSGERASDLDASKFGHTRCKIVTNPDDRE